MRSGLVLWPRVPALGLKALSDNINLGVGVKTFKQIMTLYIRALCLLLVLSLLLPSVASHQAYAQELGNKKRSMSQINDLVLDLDIKRGEEVEVKKMLERWSIKLGHIIVADPQLSKTKIKFIKIDRGRLSWSVFKETLKLNGIVVIEEEVSEGRLLIRAHVQRNLQGKEVPPYPIETNSKNLPDREEIVTAIVQIRHGAGADIYQALRTLKRRDRRRIGDILHVRGPEVLIIADLAPNVSYYTEIARSLDIKADGQMLTIRKLRWSVASELSQVVTQIIQPAGTGSAGRAAAPRRVPTVRPTARPGGATSAASSTTPQAQIIAHDPTNSLIIRAFDYQLEEIEKLIEELDIRVRDPGPKFHVYKCRNADAEDLADKLSQLFTGQSTGFSGGSTRTNSSFGNTSSFGGGSSFGNNNNSFGNNNNSFGNNNNNSFGNNNNRFGNNSLNNNRNTRNNFNNNNNNRRGATSATLSGNGNNALEVRLIADELTNSILVQAEEDDYIVVLELLRQLDVKKRRVLIEAEVWEISANDDLLITVELMSTQNTAPDSVRPLGVSSFGASSVSTDANNVRFARGPGSLSVNANGTPTLNLAQGLTAFVTRDELDKIPVLLQTLQGYSKARRVTTPFALTNDNEQATFRVTDRQPFQTTTINNVASQQNVQFVDAESTLQVQPTVNNDNSLTLRVNLIISSFGARSDPALPPPTNAREYQGTVTVPNGKFVIFGGLESQSRSFTENKIPLLGDIPILGHLFKSWRRNETSTKLYVFIRPVIFNSTQFRDDIAASDFILKRAHIEAEEEKWIPPILPSKIKRDDSELQEKVFELFGTGSGNPFRKN